MDWLRHLKNNRCGSHVPVLALLADLFEVRKAVEFGVGLNSTRAFLDRRLFPVLERLVSFEDRGEWACRVRAEVADPRWWLISAGSASAMAEAAARSVSVHGITARTVAVPPSDPIFDCVSDVGRRAADLVLVDNGVVGKPRRVVVEALRGVEFRGVVVLHDAQDKKARGIPELFPHSVVLTPLCKMPSSAVMAFDPTMVDRVAAAVDALRARAGSVFWGTAVDLGEGASA